MGMVLAFYSVSDDNLTRFHSNPPLIWRLIEPEDEEMYLDCLREGSKPSWIRRLFGAKRSSNTATVPSLTLVAGEGKEDDVDKAWQGIHYCINLTALEADPPLNFITVGGREIGDVEVGYGTVRSFNSTDVTDILSGLKNVSTQTLKANYNPSQMTKLDIYPNIWEGDEEEGLEYIIESYERLLAFLNHCAENKLGAVFYLC